MLYSSPGPVQDANDQPFPRMIPIYSRMELTCYDTTLPETNIAPENGWLEN